MAARIKVLPYWKSCLRTMRKSLSSVSGKILGKPRRFRQGFDLQNDPRDIPKLVEKLNEGYDVVNGWRFDRQDAFFSRRLPSMIANKIISIATKVKLHDYGCTLKAFRKEVTKNIRLYGEMHRFIPAVASGLGISIAEVKVNHRPRRYGTSKYGDPTHSCLWLDRFCQWHRRVLVGTPANNSTAILQNTVGQSPVIVAGHSFDFYRTAICHA